MLISNFASASGVLRLPDPLVPTETMTGYTKFKQHLWVIPYQIPSPPTQHFYFSETFTVIIRKSVTIIFRAFTEDKQRPSWPMT